MKKIISVGAVLLVGTLATGCANSNAAGAPAAAVDSAPGRALYEDIALSLYGTAADRLAAEKDSAARFQGALGTCMKNEGFTYHPVPSEQQNGGPISPGDLASIAEIGRGTFGIATAKHNQAVVADRMRAVNAASTLTGEQEAAYGKALGNCSTVAAKAEQAAPAGSGDLMKELTATFRDVEKTPAVADALDAYGPCMTEAGFPAKSHVEIFQQAFDKFPRADLGVAAMETTRSGPPLSPTRPKPPQPTPFA